MPELPEVEAVRKSLARVAGRRIVRVKSKEDRVICDRDPPRTIVRAVEGRKLVSAHRKGKYLWLELDRRPWLVFHLGMTGWLNVYGKKDPPPKHLKFQMELEGDTMIGYSDPRRFGRIRLANDPEAEAPIKSLGVDPLRGMPTAVALGKLLGARKSNIKFVLLDQSFLAGIGNYLADEILYDAGISPHRLAHELDAGEVRRLRSAVAGVIKKAVAVDADSERFPRHWLFHRRWTRKHEHTVDGAEIAREVVAGRTTVWVPSKQK